MIENLLAVRFQTVAETCKKTLKILISSLRQSFEAPIVTHFYHEFILKLDNRIRLLA